jgi:hypothetical protein
MAIVFPSGTLSGPTKVLGSAQKTITNQFSQTVSSTDTVLSGFSLSITKSSNTSRILVLVTLNHGNQGSYGRFRTILTRNNSVIAVGSSGNRRPTTFLPGATNTDSYGQVAHNIVYSDAPGNAGTYTYAIKISDLDGAQMQVFVNRGYTTENSDSYGVSCSTINLLEVET